MKQVRVVQTGARDFLEERNGAREVRGAKWEEVKGVILGNADQTHDGVGVVRCPGSAKIPRDVPARNLAD